MKYVAMLFMSVVLLAGGFAGGMSLERSKSSELYDLSSLPKYDYAQAEKDWEQVSLLEEKFGELQSQFLMLALSGGVEFTEEEKAELKRLLDVYLYWKAVAEVQVFHAKDTSEAVARGSEAMDDASWIVSGAAEKAKATSI